MISATEKRKSWHYDTYLCQWFSAVFTSGMKRTGNISTRYNAKKLKMCLLFISSAALVATSWFGLHIVFWSRCTRGLTTSAKYMGSALSNIAFNSSKHSFYANSLTAIILRAVRGSLTSFSLPVTGHSSSSLFIKGSIILLSFSINARIQWERGSWDTFASTE